MLLPAADRVELAVGPFEKEGEVLTIEDLPYNRMAGKKGIERFGTIRITPRKASTARVPARLREIASLVTGTPSATRTVKLGFKMSLRRGFGFVVNEERHHHDKPVKVGELQVWDVVNTTLMDHPSHLHGFFFEVLEHHEAGMMAHFEVVRETGEEHGHEQGNIRSHVAAAGGHAAACGTTPVHRGQPVPRRRGRE